MPDSRFQNGPVSPEFIQKQPFDPRPFLRLQQRQRSVELGEHAAPVNVPHQQHRRVHQLRKAHIHNVVPLQIDLRGTSGPLYHNDVMFRRERVISRQNLRDQGFFINKIRRRVHLPPDSSVDNDLTSHVRGGFEQHRIHPHIRFNPRRFRLNSLCAPHFAAGERDKGVERHILALEGCRAPAVLTENTAQRRTQKALARAGLRSLYHQLDGHSSASPLVIIAAAAAISRSFSR